MPRMMAWRTGKRPMLEVRRVLGWHERERDHAVGLRVGERLRLVRIDEQRDSRGAGPSGTAPAPPVGAERP